MPEGEGGEEEKENPCKACCFQILDCLAVVFRGIIACVGAIWRCIQRSCYRIKEPIFSCIDKVKFTMSPHKKKIPYTNVPRFSYGADLDIWWVRGRSGGWCATWICKCICGSRLNVCSLTSWLDDMKCGARTCASDEHAPLHAVCTLKACEAIAFYYKAKRGDLRLLSHAGVKDVSLSMVFSFICARCAIPLVPLPPHHSRSCKTVCMFRSSREDKKRWEYTASVSRTW